MNDTDYIPIAAVNQYAYCPHRCWRMFCAGEFTDNQYTIEGTGLHDRVHTVGEGHREETWQVRAIWLKSERYKLIGKSDLIESTMDRFIQLNTNEGDEATGTMMNCKSVPKPYALRK
jgi:CRISPR-associated exonuclease Cas4